MVRRHLEDAPVALGGAGAGNWNNDYSDPIHGVAPQADLVEAHAGYLFAAGTEQDGLIFPNRLRWSHPTSPTDWAELDFIDISTGGNRITALISYEDHLLIFKPDSIWALYGYDLDSWQLVQKSSTIGTKSPQSVTRSETACFFYSASDRGSVYAYGGERPVEIAEQLRVAFESVIEPEFIWVGWVGRRLWVTIPWTYEGATTEDSAAFIFDPSVGGRGAWTYFTSMTSSLGPIVAGSNVDSQIRPLGVLRNPEVPCLVRLDSNVERSVDTVWKFAVIGFTDPGGTDGYVVTDGGAEVIMSGMEGEEPFAASYRTPWVTADWPTRKKSFRRPDFICRITGTDHALQVRSFRDYEERNARRVHTLIVPSGGPGDSLNSGVAAIWNHFNWDDGTLWDAQGIAPTDAGIRAGASVRRGSSFGLCRALQLRVTGMTRSARWGIDAIVLKVVMRRFR